MMLPAVSVLLAFVVSVRADEPLVPVPVEKTDVPAPPLPGVEEEKPAPAGEPVSEADRKRIEGMLSKYASMKLKGVTINEQFRRRLIRSSDGERAVLGSDATSPHSFSMQAKIPDKLDVAKVQLDSAEALGPRRYRLYIQLEIPFEDLGGSYAFDGMRRLFKRPVGWRISQIKARILVRSIIDVAWKTLDNGNIGLYPGGFLDDKLPEQDRQSAKLIEDLLIDLLEVDLATVNFEGINGRIFYRDGQAVDAGLLTDLIGPEERTQLETVIEGGVNNAIRSNEAKILEGLNAALQSELPETQIVVTNFIEKLAIQANLPGLRKEDPRKAFQEKSTSKNAGSPIDFLLPKEDKTTESKKSAP